MSKIAPDHLRRQAFVYVRQSTRDQLRHHHESRRRQYGLADRARRLGLDRTGGGGGGGGRRPRAFRGRQRSSGVRADAARDLRGTRRHRAGTVEASRLARNGRDWHTLARVLRAGELSARFSTRRPSYQHRGVPGPFSYGSSGTAVVHHQQRFLWAVWIPCAARDPTDLWAPEGSPQAGHRPQDRPRGDPGRPTTHTSPARRPPAARHEAAR